MALAQNFGESSKSAGTNWWEYRDGSITMRSPNQLTDEQVTAWGDHNTKSGLYDPMKDTKQEYHRADLVKNQELIGAFKQFYKAEHNGEEFQGDDNEAVSEYYSTMRWRDSNTAVMADTAMKLNTNFYDLQTRQALKDMFTVWDKTASGFEDDGLSFKSLMTDPGKFWDNASFSWKNAGSAVATTVAAQVTDPLNYIGMIPGLNFGGKLASNAARFSMRAMLAEAKDVGAKKAIGSLMKTNVGQGIKTGALENALQNSVLNSATQNAQFQVGARDNVSVGENLLATGIAGGLGGAFGGVMAKITPKLPDYTEKVGEEFTRVEAVKARVSNRTQLRTNVVEAEKAYRAAIDANDVNHGAVRAEYRDAANMAYRSVISDYIEADFKKTNFKLDGKSTPISSLIEGDHLVNFMDMVGARPADDVATLLDKVTKFVPNPVEDAKVKLPVSSGVQQQAVMTGLLNAAWNDIQDSAIHNTGDDVYNLTSKWIAGNNLLTANTSESGYVLRLARERNNLSFGIMDFEKFSPADRLDIVDTIRNASDSGQAMGMLNRLKAFQESELVADKILKTADKINSVGVLNMLSSVNSSIGNMFGTMKMPFDIGERYIGALWRGHDEGAEFSVAQSQAFLNNIDFHAMGAQIFDTFATSKETLIPSMYNKSAKEGYGHLNLKFGEMGSLWKQLNQLPMDAEGKALPSVFEHSEVGSGTVKDVGLMATNMVMAMTRLIGEKGMLTTDEITSQLAVRSHLFASLILQAKKDGLSPKAALDFAKTEQARQLDALVIESKVGSSAGRTAEMERAIKYAQETKFQGSLQKGMDIGQLGTWATKWKDINQQEASTALEAFAKGGRSIVMTHTMPFIRTPANILNYNFEHTPVLSIASKKFRRIMQTGTEMEKDEATGAMLTGTIGWIGAMDAALSGNITGGGPDRWDAKKIAQGGTNDGGQRQPTYTLRLGGNTFSLRSAAPFTFPLMVMGDIADFYRYGGAEVGNHAVAGLALHAAGFLKDYPALKGIGETAKMIGDISNATGDNKVVAGMSKSLAKSMTEYIPGNGFLKNFPPEHHREALDWLDELKKGIPFYNSEELGFTRDPISGEIRQYPTAGTGETISWPLVKAVKGTVDPVNSELVRQQLDIPAISNLLEGEDLKRYKSGITGRPMYDRLQEKIGEVRLTSGRYKGLNLYDALDTLIKSDEYLSNNTQEVYYPEGAGGRQMNRNVTRKQAALHFLINEYRTEATVLFEKELKVEAEKGEDGALSLYRNLNRRRQFNDRPAVFGN